MSEQQRPPATNFTYTTEGGVSMDISVPGQLSDDQVNSWLDENIEEIEIEAGLKEPGFGPFTMGAVPTESVEQWTIRCQTSRGYARHRAWPS